MRERASNRHPLCRRLIRSNVCAIKCKFLDCIVGTFNNKLNLRGRERGGDGRKSMPMRGEAGERSLSDSKSIGFSIDFPSSPSDTLFFISGFV